MIFKAIADFRPYPEHGFQASRQWAGIPPRQIRLTELITTKATLDLASLLSDDSTFYGDLFAHVVFWQGNYYLEDGLHRAVRAALRGRGTLHARVLNLDELMAVREREADADAAPGADQPDEPGGGTSAEEAAAAATPPDSGLIASDLDGGLGGR